MPSFHGSMPWVDARVVLVLVVHWLGLRKTGVPTTGQGISTGHPDVTVVVLQACLVKTVRD